MFRSIDWSLRPTGRIPWIILRRWGFLFVTNAGRRGKKTKSLNLVTVIVICSLTKHFPFLRNPFKRDREFLIELNIARNRLRAHVGRHAVFQVLPYKFVYTLSFFQHYLSNFLVRKKSYGSHFTKRKQVKPMQLSRKQSIHGSLLYVTKSRLSFTNHTFSM